MCNLDPPRAHKQTRRPRKLRKRQVYETVDGGKRIRKQIIVHCTRCKATRRNRANCPHTGNAENAIETAQARANEGKKV